MTVSIHATSGWALVISLHQSTGLATQLRRQGRKGGGKPTAFPPSLCHFLPLSSCPSVSLTLTQTLLLWRLRFIIVPSRNLWLSLVLRPSVCSSPVRVRQVCLIFACVSPSLPVIFLHEDTPTQMISRHFLSQRGPRAASFPPSRDNLPSVICSHASQVSPLHCPWSFYFLPVFSLFFTLTVSLKNSAHIQLICISKYV